MATTDLYNEPVRITESSLHNIASAIRSKNGLSTLYTPAQMASAIRAIGEDEDDELFNAVVDRTVSSIYNNTVSYIGSYAFQNCRTLTTAIFPAAKSISDSAFYDCPSLATVSFPIVTRIGSYAFQECTRLTTANFSVATYIGSSAFQDCTALTTVNFPVATYIGSYAFQYCTTLTMASFPAAITIGSSAFQGCIQLTTASFPMATTIGGYAFRYCTQLTSFYLTSVNSVPTLGASVFFSTPIGGYSTAAGQYGLVYVPASLYSLFLTATNWTSISSRIASM